MEAAFSLKMVDELGNIVSGKLANFTILDDNPLTCEPMKIREIGVWGTVHEGRGLPVQNATESKVKQSRKGGGDQGHAHIRALNAAQLAAIQQGSGSLAMFLDPTNRNLSSMESGERICTCGSPLVHSLFSFFDSTANPSVSR